MTGKLISLVILLFSFSIISNAQVKAILGADNQNISSEDVFSVQLIIEGDTDAELVKIENIEKFHVEGQSTSSSYKFINGKSSKEKIINYELSLKSRVKNGEIFFGPAIISSEGKELKSNYLVFQINDISGKRGQKNNKYAAGDRLYFLDLKIEKDKLFVNEKTLLVLKFYNSVEFAEANLVSPESKKFWLEQSGKQINSREVVNGKAYKVTTIKYFLTPLIHGTFELSGFALNGLAIIPDNSKRGRNQRQRLGFGFDSFFNDSLFRARGKRRRVSIQAPIIRLEVNKIPNQKDEKNFDGVVGSFKIREIQDYNDEIDINDSLSFSFIVSGTGGLNLLKFDQQGQDFKVYKDKDEKISLSRGQLPEGRKISFLLIPQKTGDLKLPKFTTTFLDPIEKSYETIGVGGAEIRVTGSASPKRDVDELSTAPLKKIQHKDEKNKLIEKKDTQETQRSLFEIPESGMIHKIVSKILSERKIILTSSFFFALFLIFRTIFISINLTRIIKIFSKKNTQNQHLEKLLMSFSSRPVVARELDSYLELVMNKSYSPIRYLNLKNLKDSGVSNKDISSMQLIYKKMEESQFSNQKSELFLTDVEINTLKNIAEKYNKIGEK